MTDPRPIAEQAMADEGLVPRTWSTQAGFRFSRHSHPYHKVLYCLEGSITFHTTEGDVDLEPGGRLDLPPGTEHGASVGPAGVTCLEAARY
ncbi:MAG: cupin domain-containing protein [Acidimicrobiia bacterium]